MLMPFNQLTTAPPSETRWFLYLPWQPTWILAPGMSLFFSLNLISCCCLVAKSYQTLCDPMGCSPPGSLSMVFPRQEYWSGLPLPSANIWIFAFNSCGYISSNGSSGSYIDSKFKLLRNHQTVFIACAHLLEAYNSSLFFENLFEQDSSRIDKTLGDLVFFNLLSVEWKQQ